MPQHPEGQHFILREHLERVFAKAPFSSELWIACTKAFLGYRALPVLASNVTTLAPASFFLNLNSASDPAFGTERNGRWGEVEFRRALSALGEEKLQQFVVTDGTRSWAIYLSEDLQYVRTFHGRSLANRYFAPQEDERDLAEGELVRDLFPGISAKVETLDLSGRPAAKVILALQERRRYELSFVSCGAIRSPAAGSDVGTHVTELRGPSGRTWFVFRPDLLGKTACDPGC